MSAHARSRSGPATVPRPAREAPAAPSRPASPRMPRGRRLPTRLLTGRRALLAVVVLVVGAALSWVVFWSSLLDVREVTVTGERRLPERVVLGRADVPLAVPLARVDVDRVAARVAKLAPVAKVDVVRRWPHHVEIVVVERRAAAAVPVGESYRLVDRAGRPFATVDSRPRRLPMVRAELDRPSDVRTVAAALEVLRALPPGIARRVNEAEAFTTDDIRLSLRDGSVVLWGDAGRTERKAVVLRALMSPKAGMAGDIEVYDVSAPDVPTTR